MSARAQVNRSRTDNEKYAELCVHMRAVFTAADNAGVQIGACGDCGSAWMTCADCALQVEKVQDVYDAPVREEVIVDVAASTMGDRAAWSPFGGTPGYVPKRYALDESKDE